VAALAAACGVAGTGLFLGVLALFFGWGKGDGPAARGAGDHSATPDAVGIGEGDAESPQAVDGPEASATDAQVDSGLETDLRDVVAKLSPSLFAEEATAALAVTRDQPILGRAGAPVTLVLFGDLTCPHTRSLYADLRALRSSAQDDLRLVFRNRPISTHEQARPLAELLAEAHLRRGASLSVPLLDALLTARVAADSASLAEQARRVGGEGWVGTPASAEAVELVAADLELAELLGVRESPTLFINGLRLSGKVPRAELEQAVARERRRALLEVSAGVPRERLYAERTKANLIGIERKMAERECPVLSPNALPARGARAPLVTIVEFSDYTCDFSRRAQPTLDRVLERHASEVAIHRRDLPSEARPVARLLAGYLREIAAAQGPEAYFTVQNTVFAPSAMLDEKALEALEQKLGLPLELRDRAERGSQEAAIDADVKLADSLRVAGTPTFFVNGRRIEGAERLQVFERLITEELRAARRLIAFGIKQEDLYEALCGF
jgi:protein-disulfide isomerase